MKKSVSIIGGGPAAMAIAAFLDPLKFDITIYEKNKTLGRKFLVAGKGGFNLTHAEPIEQFIPRYTPSHFLQSALRHFDNHDTREWLQRLGISTFIGSSQRVYPEKGIKPIQVLDAILNELKEHGVNIMYEYNWAGWSQTNELKFYKKSNVKSDYTIFALGGASWKVTGSDGGWLNTFQEKHIQTIPFQVSNCAFKINWPKEFIAKYEGHPIKNIAIQCGDKTQKGEAVITKFGIEGNAIYALSPEIRYQLNKGTAHIFIDLKPMMSREKIVKKFETSNSRNNSATLKNGLNLNQLKIDLIKFATTKETFLNTPQLAQVIKRLEIEIIDNADIDEGISTVGGISLESIDQHFELRQIPNSFSIGEMLDYDAPTGGYLLQACFSMGAYLADYLNSKE